MKAETLIAKMSGMCTRPYCFEPCSESSVECELHRLASVERKRRHRAKVRPRRRQSGRCADCDKPCALYRCEGGCGRRQLTLAGVTT